MNATATYPPAHQRRALAPVLLLVMALLLAQTLGFMHRIVHGQPGHAVARTALKLAGGATALQAAGPEEGATPVVPRGFLASLFNHNEDDPSCRLYDQASSFDTLASVPSLVLPMAVTSFVLLYFQGEVLARWVALFDARGPPSVR